LPINAITSLLGAPAVIAILIKNRNLSKSFT
jgi:ABC-type Fe3+-siderophore transport system permease subunit